MSPEGDVFDRYAEAYDRELEKGLKFSGEDKQYFAESRIRWVKTLLDKVAFKPKMLMDFGCGIGSSVRFLLDIFGGEKAVGVDTSEKAVAIAEKHLSGDRRYEGTISFRKMKDDGPREVFDLIYCNGVFHHIRPNERGVHLQYIHRALKPGGYFSYWENNPWNPGTKYVMRQIPFDADAQTLTPPESCRLLTKNGFTVVSTTHRFLFPRVLSLLRPLEGFLTRVPLMAQYHILSKKADVMKEKQPNFLYVGTSRAGTDWFFRCMQEHPEIYVPPSKDVKFFDRKFDQGLAWYLSFFKNAGEEKAIGELTHDYFLDPGTARRIQQNFPKIKILACIREPLDKMKSDYRYARMHYLDKNVKFLDFVFDDNDISVKALFQQHNLGKRSANYYQNLKPYYELFPREKIKVVFFDDLKASPRKVIGEVFSFLGVDPNCIPSVLEKKVNASREARVAFVGHLLYSVAGTLRKLGFENLLGRVKTSEKLEKLFYKKAKDTFRLSDEERRQLFEYFSEDYDKLAELVGRQLPEGWWQYAPRQAKTVVTR